MQNKKILEKLYIDKNMSMKEISDKLNCSPNKIYYWMKKYHIKRRTISDAIYLKNNSSGDPFKQQPVDSIEKAVIFGLGIGIYLGEGNKKNTTSVKLGNTDVYIIKTFIKFLIKIFDIDVNRLRYSLQIFSDIDPDQALNYWLKELETDKSKFSKVTITKSKGSGTYHNKNINGVLTVYFHNRKLRDIIVSMCRDSSAGRALPW